MNERLVKIIRKVVLRVNQETMAEELGISQGYISKLETGAVERPSYTYLCAMREVYGMDVNKFLDFQASRRKPRTIDPWCMFPMRSE